ncbi:MAG: DUF3467 domain-containing protein [Thermoprotei archaeon]|jgi:hypothetical protein
MSIPRFETKRAADYKVVHVSGVVGGINPNEGTIIVFVDKLVPKTNPDGTMAIDSIERELIMELKMSPLQFKSIAEWMQMHIKEYEKMFGEIKMEGIPPKPSGTKTTLYG